MRIAPTPIASAGIEEEPPGFKETLFLVGSLVGKIFLWFPYAFFLIFGFALLLNLVPFNEELTLKFGTMGHILLGALAVLFADKQKPRKRRKKN